MRRCHLNLAAVLATCMWSVGGCGSASEDAPQEGNSGASAPSAVPANAVGARAPDDDGSSSSAAPASSSAASAAAGVPATSGPPRLELEQGSLHFGRLRENEVRVGQIRFTNAGGSLLSIVDVKTTCGCTVANIPRRTLQPGETGSVEVTFDPSGPGAGQRKYVNIISNSLGETAHVTQVAVEADVDPLLVVEPRILNVGVLRMGEEFRTFLDVGFLNETFEITRVHTHNPVVQARVLPERRPPAPGSDAAAMAHGATVEVVVTREALWGSLFSWIEIHVAGRPSASEPPMQHEARLRLQGQVFGDVLAVPDTLRFGVEPGQTFEREIKLTHRDGLPFELELAELAFPGMEGSTVDVIRERPHEYVVILRGSGSQVERNYQGLVHLRTNVPGEETIDLRIIGIVRPTPITIGR